MKIFIQLCLVVLVIVSCKTKKDIPVEVKQEQPTPEALEKTDIPVATLKKMPRDERMRGPKIDPEQVIAQLGLDEAQEMKFLAFWERNQAEMDQLRKERTGDRYVSREKIKELRERGRQELEGILTPEQYAQYKKILAKDRMRQRRGQ